MSHWPGISFQEITRIPPCWLDLDRLDDGNGIEATLMTNRAQWHKACRVKYNLTKLQRRRKSLEKVEQSDAPMVHTRSAHSHVTTKNPLCFFCNKPAGSELLHEASTKMLDFNVRKAALETEDTELLAKIAPGDMMALEAKYHRNFLRMLYNKTRKAVSKDEHEEDAQPHGIAFAELVAFMEGRRSDDCAPVFKLADLGNLYQVRLEQLGATEGNRIHTTRLKNRLLSELPGLLPHSQGRDTLLTFQDDIGDALKKACDQDSDAMPLGRAAQVVRREMFATKFNFGVLHAAVAKRLPSSVLPFAYAQETVNVIMWWVKRCQDDNGRVSQRHLRVNIILGFVFILLSLFVCLLSYIFCLSPSIFIICSM